MNGLASMREGGLTDAVSAPAPAPGPPAAAPRRIRGAMLEGGKPFDHNWHLDALEHHLRMVFEGRYKRLVITLPPRSLKSLYASIAFPA